MSWLLDGNALIAATIVSHPLHLRAKTWLEGLGEAFHTGSVTEGTFLRLHMMLALDTSSSAAWEKLRLIQSDPMHRFIDDGTSYLQVRNKGIQGHKQVTDAWLAELARRHGIKLATLDQGLAQEHPDVAFLIP